MYPVFVDMKRTSILNFAVRCAANIYIKLARIKKKEHFQTKQLFKQKLYDRKGFIYTFSLSILFLPLIL